MNRSFHFNGHVIELNSDGEPFTPLGRLQRQFHPDEFKKAVAALQDNGNAPLVGGLIPDASPAPTPSSGTKSATLKSKPAVSKPTAQTKSQTTRGNSNGSHTPETDEAAYKRLAELTLGQYDRVREAEAGSLGIKPGTLDKEVQARRPEKDRDDGKPGRAVVIKDIEPWPEPVDGQTILNEVANTIRRFIWFKNGAKADAVTLWCAHTHVFRHFYRTPRMHFKSPDGGCGKSSLLTIMECCVNKPDMTGSPTAATTFRTSHDNAPTFLYDEAQNWLNEDNQDMMAIFNSGSEPGRPAKRCAGENNENREFDTFCPMATAGLKFLPANLHERAIVILIPKIKDEQEKLEAKIENFGAKIQEALRQLNLSRKLARWLKDNSDKLPSSPQLPRGLINRPADNWMPLFAIAELAGGDWPGRCLVAFHLIHHPENDPKSERTQLLSNLRPFIAEAVETGEEFMATEHILSFLNSEPELGYSVKLRGHPVHDKWLAAQMDTIKSTKFRPEEEGGKQVRGYSVAAIWDEIERYAPVKSEAEEDSERVDL